MGSTWLEMDDDGLEAALIDLGDHVYRPPAPNLAQTVREQLVDRPAAMRLGRVALRRALVYPLLIVVALIGSLLAFSPAARHAVASWFQLAGVTITEGHPTSRPERNLDLGRLVTLTQAQARVPFPIVVPHAPNLGRPDAVYVNPLPGGPVSLVYAPREGLPEASTTDVGLLITEFRGSGFAINKFVGSYRVVRMVTIRGQPGVWVSGLHAVTFIRVHGKLRRLSTRRAGNVLLWQHGRVLVRLEGRISERRTLAVAESMTELRPTAR